MENYVTVSQLNGYLKGRISEDENLSGLFIRGEISNFTNHLKTGHFYFTLKDEKAAIKAVMFRGSAQYVRFRPENGMNVIVFGRVGFYERDGALQIYCEDMQPDGIGALSLAFEQLKSKLEKEGLFDIEHKKTLPRFPQKIAVITAKTGAALQDILNILGRRYPVAEVVLLSSLVQGDQAPDSIVSCFQRLKGRSDIDVVILARGGGSLEDLWAFNSEKVARAVYDCEIPVISAVGHEVDFTIADFVADYRAPTPSAAAEVVAVDIRELESALDNAQKLLYNYTEAGVTRQIEALKTLHHRLSALSPQSLLGEKQRQLVSLSSQMTAAMMHHFDGFMQRFSSDVHLLDALSPLRILTRGYSITFFEGKPVTDSSTVRAGQMLRTKLQCGEIVSEVVNTNGDEKNDTRTVFD